MNGLIKKTKNKSDLKQIAKIYQESFSESPFNENWTLKESVEKIKIFLRYCDIWVYKIEKEVIGFMIVNPHQWRIGEVIFREEIAVKKDFRRKGIATKLMKNVLNYYKEKGYKLSIGIINKDAKSFGFIKKFNMKIDKNDLLVIKELK